MITNKHFKEILSIILFIFTLNTICPAGASITVPSQGIKTITDGLIKAKSGDTVWVQPGIYKEHISVMSGVTLISQELFKAVIDGKGRGDVVSISHKSAIIGFEIRSGNTGVISRGPGNIIKKCKIYKNRGTGIICMGNLALMESNIIIFNEASGIQALDITSGATTINHNTIAYNGNNGIVYSGTAGITIENNIIVANSGQGIKSQVDEKKLNISHNVFFSNHQFNFTLPEKNFSFDPLFTAPKRKILDFTLRSDSKAIKKGNDKQDIGALFGE